MPDYFQQLNTIRHELIQKKYIDGLTTDEEAMLNGLQSIVDQICLRYSEAEWRVIEESEELIKRILGDKQTS